MKTSLIFVILFAIKRYIKKKKGIYILKINRTGCFKIEQTCLDDRSSLLGEGRERALIDKGSRTFSRDIYIWKVQNVSDTCDSIL